MSKSKIRYVIFFMSFFSKINFSQNIFNEINIKNNEIEINFDNVSKKYINSEMNQKSIESLMNDLTQKLIDDGYVTSRISFKDGNVNEGKINLEVESGKISNIKFLDNADDNRKIDFAFGEYKERILNVNDLNRGIENLNVLNDNHIMKIKSSDKNAYSDVIIQSNKGKDRSLEIGFNIDKDVVRSKKLNFNLDFERANFFSANDILKFNFTNGFSMLNPKKNDTSFQASIKFPYDKYKFKYDLNLSYSNDLIKGENGRYSISNLNLKNIFSIDANVYKKGKENIEVGIRGEIEKHLTHIQGKKIKVQSYNKYKLNFDAKYSKKMDTSNLALNTNYEISKNTNADDFNQKFKVGLSYNKNKIIEKNLLNHTVEIGFVKSNQKFYLGSESRLRGNFVYNKLSNKEMFVKNTLTYSINRDDLSISPYAGLDISTNFKNFGSSFTLGMRINKDKWNANFNYNRAINTNGLEKNLNNFNFSLGYKII